MNNKMTADQIIYAVDKLKKDIEDSLGYETYYMHVHTGGIDTRNGWCSEEIDDRSIDMAIQVGDLIEVEFDYSSMSFEEVTHC